jgi:hypothetical protein
MLFNFKNNHVPLAHSVLYVKLKSTKTSDHNTYEEYETNRILKQSLEYKSWDKEIMGF